MMMMMIVIFDPVPNALITLLKIHTGPLGWVQSQTDLSCCNNNGSICLRGGEIDERQDSLVSFAFLLKGKFSVFIIRVSGYFKSLMTPFLTTGG